MFRKENIKKKKKKKETYILHESFYEITEF